MKLLFYKTDVLFNLDKTYIYLMRGSHCLSPLPLVLSQLVLLFAYRQLYGQVDLYQLCH